MATESKLSYKKHPQSGEQNLSIKKEHDFLLIRRTFRNHMNKKDAGSEIQLLQGHPSRENNKTSSIPYLLQEHEQDEWNKLMITGKSENT